MNCWNLNMILDAYKKGDVYETLKLHSISDSSYLLWPKPKYEDIEYLTQILVKNDIQQVVSIGAGSGLFEWALEIISGIQVNAVELDVKYWEKTARPKFKKHIFYGETILNDLLSSEKTAIFFSYFNNYKYFLNYLDQFLGHLLIIVGPEVSGRYSMPTPFDSKVPKNWILKYSKEIQNNDFISVYIKIKYHIPPL